MDVFICEANIMMFTYLGESSKSKSMGVMVWCSMVQKSEFGSIAGLKITSTR